VTGGASIVEVHGLERGVRRLVSTKKWTGRCEVLKHEITDFVSEVRSRVNRIRPDLSLVIAS
jgi:hypothetical protein